MNINPLPDPQEEPDLTFEEIMQILQEELDAIYESDVECLTLDFNDED